MRDVKIFKSELVFDSVCTCVEKVAQCCYFFSLVIVFRQRGRFCLTTPMGLLTHFSQEEPFDLSQKPPGLPNLRLSQSDGESVPGSSCQEEDDESLYRRSQYSPEVDQHEPAGEDQFIPELEERGQGSPDELRPGKKQRPTYQESLDDETFEGESAAEGQSVDPRGDQVHLLQSEGSYDSDVELGEQAYTHEKGCRQPHDYDSDSEVEDDQQDLDEPEQSKQQLDGFYEAAIDVAERNQSSLETGEFTSRGDKEEEKE